MTKVFAFGLAIFSGAFLLAMVLSICLIFVDQTAFTAAHPLEYVALAVLLIIPFYGLSTSFRTLSSQRASHQSLPKAYQWGHLMLVLGLIGLYTRITVPPGASSIFVDPSLLSSIQFLAIALLVSGSVLLWRFRHHS